MGLSNTGNHQCCRSTARPWLGQADKHLLRKSKFFKYRGAGFKWNTKVTCWVSVQERTKISGSVRKLYLKLRKSKSPYPFWLPRNLILKSATVCTDLVINVFNCFPTLKKRVGFCQGDDTDPAKKKPNNKTITHCSCKKPHLCALSNPTTLAPYLIWHLLYQTEWKWYSDL